MLKGRTGGDIDKEGVSLLFMVSQFFRDRVQLSHIVAQNEQDV